MTVFLLMALLALDDSQIATDSVETPQVKHCKTVMLAQVRGELSQLTVTKTRRIGRTMILSGTVIVFKRPPTRPGEMTPTHLVGLPYYYDCRWRGHGKARVRLTPKSN